MEITQNELLKILKKRNVPEDAYSLEVGLSNGKLCLAKTNFAWKVYYSERGRETELEIFLSEHEACLAFYERIKRMIK